MVEDEDVGKGGADEVDNGAEEPGRTSAGPIGFLGLGKGTMLSSTNSGLACRCCPDPVGSCIHILKAQAGRAGSSARWHLGLCVCLRKSG